MTKPGVQVLVFECVGTEAAPGCGGFFGRSRKPGPPPKRCLQCWVIRRNEEYLRRRERRLKDLPDTVSCVVCGRPIESWRPGKRGSVPRRCLVHREEHKKAGSRKRARKSYKRRKAKRRLPAKAAGISQLARLPAGHPDSSTAGGSHSPARWGGSRRNPGALLIPGANPATIPAQRVRLIGAGLQGPRPGTGPFLLLRCLEAGPAPSRVNGLLARGRRGEVAREGENPACAT